MNDYSWQNLSLALRMQFLLVLTDVRRARKFAIADVARVQKFACVRSHMVLECARLREPLRTLGTLKRSFPRMTPHMNAEVRRRAEPLVADGARVHLLAGVVRAHVPLQVAESRELRSAFRARERPLAGVPAHVVFQRAHPHELRLADAARVVWPRLVRPQVHVQAAAAAERLVTDLARIWTVVGMQSHMDSQPG